MTFRTTDTPPLPSTTSRHLPVIEGPFHLRVDADHVLTPGQDVQVDIELTTPSEIFEELSSYWSQRWSRIQQLREAHLRRIISFAEVYMPRSPWIYEPLDLTQWQYGLKRFTSRSARGPDGYDFQDLRNMPPTQQATLLQLITDVEQGQPWPQQLLEGHAVGIPKTTTATMVQDFRPVVITSLIQRNWSSLRAKQATRRLALMVPFMAMGFLPNREPGELWLTTQALIEHSLQHEAPLLGHITDICKAFGHLPRQPIAWYSMASLPPGNAFAPCWRLASMARPNESTLDLAWPDWKAAAFNDGISPGLCSQLRGYDRRGSGLSPLHAPLLAQDPRHILCGQLRPSGTLNWRPDPWHRHPGCLHGPLAAGLGSIQNLLLGHAGSSSCQPYQAGAHSSAACA